jgi:hypothetical protein
MANRDKKDKDRKAILVGSQAETCFKALNLSGIKTVISSERALEKNLEKIRPNIIVIHEKASRCLEVIQKVKQSPHEVKMPVLAVISPDECFSGDKYDLFGAGADEVVLESQGIEAVTEAATVLLEMNFPRLGEDIEGDTVARALDAAKTFGVKAYEQEEEKQPRLDMRSSIACAIDIAQKKYVGKKEGFALEITVRRKKRADTAIGLFCQMLGIEPGASLSDIKTAVTRLVGDLGCLEKASEEALALRTAAQAILALSE